jgi:hypothetical protein
MRTEIHWIVEEFDPANGLGSLVSPARELGIHVHLVDYCRTHEVRWEQIPGDAFLVFSGSLQEFEVAQRQVPHGRVGAFGQVGDFDTARYLPWLGESALNKGGFVCTGYDARLRAASLFRNLSAQSPIGKVFLRPNSANKEFGGRMVDSPDSLSAVLAGQDATQIWVAPAMPVAHATEFRCIVQRDEARVVSVGSGHRKCTGTADAAKEFAEQCARDLKIYPLPPLYCLDVVAMSSADWRVVEMGHFPTSAIYDAPPEPIVAAVAQIARL